MARNICAEGGVGKLFVNANFSLANKQTTKGEKMRERAGTMTLREALQWFEGRILTDGNQDWDSQNLLQTLEQKAAIVLSDPVYVDEIGVREIDKDGYLGDYLYSVKDADVDYCESCAAAGIRRPATTYRLNADYSTFNLCYECMALLERLNPTNKEET
jgi:hypothetical protein